MKKISYEIQERKISGSNWGTAKDLFPTIEVNQEGAFVTITSLSVKDKKNIGCTHELTVDISEDGQSMFIRGMTGLKNWKHPQCGGRQSFCYAVFRGDSGHIYTHRAVASKEWMTDGPEKIKARLRKLGIGADSRVIQQGDFLLKPANGKSLPLDQLKHEWTSSSHHRFSEPLLSEYVPGTGRIIYIPEGRTVELHHEAVDGIQHPMVIVPAGQWIIGTTSSGLAHPNKRD